MIHMRSLFVVAASVSAAFTQVVRAQAPYTDYVGGGHAVDISVSASSVDETATGAKTVDGSGLSGVSHGTTWDDGWVGYTPAANPVSGRAAGHWLRYDLGHVYTLGYSHIWNSNEVVERGLRSVTVDYSTDGASWTELGTFEFAQASGSTGDGGAPGPDFGGISARYVVLTANSNWEGAGGDGWFGLSELRINVDGSTGIGGGGGGGGGGGAPQNPLVYQGSSGLGVGKHIVFVASEHEYRGEEALPGLARILAHRHGFKCTVLFGLDGAGNISAGSSNIPGLSALGSADLMVIATRFVAPSDAQMVHIESYLDLGKPVVGLRTASHGFQIQGTYAKYDHEAPASTGWEGGFGRRVLGNNWVDQLHYGENNVQATRVELNPAQSTHPILRGVGDNAFCFAGAYGATVRPDFNVLAYSQPLQSMSPGSGPAAGKPRVASTWTRQYTSETGVVGRVFYSSQGASQDILDASYRRLLLNGILWAVGLETGITPSLDVSFVGPYVPSAFAFDGAVQNVKPADLANLTSPIMPGNGDPELLPGPTVDLQPTEEGGGPVRRSLTIRNSGATRVLNISGVTFSGTASSRFGNATFPATIAPGATGVVEFTFTPGTSGLSTAKLVVSSDAQGAATTEFPLQINTFPPLVDGITFRVYQANRALNRMPVLSGDPTPNIDEARSSIDYKDANKDGVADAGSAGNFGTVPPLERLEHLYCEAIGVLTIANAGAYNFRLLADDGAQLLVGGKVIINNTAGERPSPVAAESGPVQLAAGHHNLLVKYWNGTGGPCLKLEWQKPGSGAWETVAAHATGTNPDGLKTETYTRVVSPGGKAVTYPGEGQTSGQLPGLHPGYNLFTIAGDFQAAGGSSVFNPPDILITGTTQAYRPETGAIGFLPDGRLLQTSFNPTNPGSGAPPPEGQNHKMYAVTGATGGDIRAVTVAEVANGLNQPLGMAVVGNVVYVAEVRKISRLEDLNGDGDFLDSGEKTDLVPVMPTPGGPPSTGWYSENFHHFTFGLIHQNGWLYGTLSATFDGEFEGGNGANTANRGTWFRVNISPANGAVGTVEYLAGGLRTPNGIGLGPEGKMFGTDNQGSWNPDNSLYEFTRGHFYGHYHSWTASVGLNNVNRQPAAFWDSPVYWASGETKVYASPYQGGKRRFTHPAVYLPQNDMCNSPTDPVLIGDQHPAFKGQMFIGEHRNGGVRRAFVEKINGRFQGAAFRFTQGLSCGANSMRWGPDGALYLGGIGGEGNWKWRNTTFGLERLKFTGVDAFEIQTLRAVTGGFIMTMTKPAAAGTLGNIGNYEPIPTASYPNMSDEYGAGKVEGPTLTVTAAQELPGGRSVRLTVPGITAETVLHLRLRSAVRSAAGEQLWSGEAFYTMNSLPNALESAWAEWVSRYFPGSADLAVIGMTANPDGDEDNNLSEFYSGGNPAVADASGTLRFSSASTGQAITVTSREPTSAPAPLRVRWRATGDLVTWTDVTSSMQLVEQTPAGSGHRIATYRYTPAGGAAKVFIQRVIEVPSSGSP